MPIEIKTVFFVRCNNCTVPLHSTTLYDADSPTPTTYFPTPLAALHRALQQQWTATANGIYCPTCTPPTEPSETQTPARDRRRAGDEPGQPTDS